jgi:hypothetical protein
MENNNDLRGKDDLKETKNDSSPSVEHSEPSEPSATTNESYFRSGLARLVEKNGGIFKGNELQDYLVGTPAWTEATLLIKNALENGEIEAVEVQYDTYRIV